MSELHCLNPDLLNDAQIARIKDAFSEIATDSIQNLEVELNSERRSYFDKEVLGAYNLESEYENIKTKGDIAVYNDNIYHASFKKPQLLMRKLSFLFLATALSFVSCNKSSKHSSGKQSKTVSGQGVQSGYISGVYKGTLPCADCPGIKTTLKFKRGKKVEKTTLYMESNDTGSTTKGTYKVDQSDSVIVVMLPDEENEFYRMKSDSTIVRLNSDKEEVTGPLAKAYVLTKKHK